MILKCECGSDIFNVTERLWHRASIDKGKLTIFKNTSSFTEDIITCAECEKDYSLLKDFDGVIEYAG